MQFDHYYNFETQELEVTFHSFAHPSLEFIFNRIGGQKQGSLLSWTFKNSHSPVPFIKQIIHNTCYVCGGLMQDEGIALKNEDVFVKTTFRGEDALIPYPQSGEAKLKQGRKCSVCGHFHT